MYSTHVNGNANNNGEMEDEFDNCTDDKVCVYETVIRGGFMNEELHDTDNKQRSILNDITIPNENINDQTVEDFINEEPWNMEHNQGSNYVRIKDENIDDLTVIVIPETELEPGRTNDKMSLNKTVIGGGYIKQEPYGVQDEQGTIQNYPSMKDGNIDDLTVVAQETESLTDYIDNKLCVYETKISGGYIKEEPCDTGDESGRTHSNIDKKGCEECGEKYDLYCLKCPMLIRILNRNNPDGTDNTDRRTLPQNFIDICETPSGVGTVALRDVPKGVVLGPFEGLNSTKDEAISKWKLKNEELPLTKDPEELNWMQYIRRADKNSQQNLIPFQYEEELYYRSECRINVGDELLVRWGGDGKENEIQDIKNSYWEPEICESLDDSYACTFCCVGYKSISHLKAHNSTCTEKTNKQDFCKEIVQCDICKIYLDKKEYSDYHMDRCDKGDEKCIFNSRYRTKRGRPLRYRIHNDDRPFSCSLCPYKAATKSHLKQHIAIHNDDRPFSCTLCSYKARTRNVLERHIAVHNNDKPFACTICPYKTRRKSVLKQHINVHNGDKPFACIHCMYRAATKSHLKQHIAVHNDHKPFACTLCPYKATRVANLKRHILVHNGDGPFACTICPYKTKIKLPLINHIAIHNGHEPLAYIVCPSKTTSETNLEPHTVVDNDDKRFACTFCPYKTTRGSNLKRHILIHNGDGPFACTLCPYKTKTNLSLIYHIAMHNGDKPFTCIFCPYKTTTKSYLKRHIAIHDDDKALACTVCPYKTTRKSHLKRHLTIHNGDKRFACTLCPYKAATKSHLKQHVVVHNDNSHSRAPSARIRRRENRN